MSRSTLGQSSPGVPLVYVWSNACGSSNITITNSNCGSLLVGNSLSVEVNVTNAPAFDSFELFLFYDPNFINATDIDLTTGTVFGNGNPNNLVTNPLSPAGTVRLAVANFFNPSSYTGANGTIVHIIFKILKVGVSPLALSAGIPSSGGAGTQLLSAGVPVQVDTSDGYFKNQPGSDPAVVYDSNGNGVFDPGETVLAGLAPTSGTGLKDDPKIKYRDSNGNNVWDSTEGVFYDSNLNNVFDLGEKVIFGSPESGTVRDDPKISYVDVNGNNAYDTLKLGPMANFTYTPTVPAQGDLVTFNATNSFDPDGGLLAKYRWDIGTGSTSIGQAATYSVPLSAGSYSIRLTVTDLDDNFTAMQVQRVDVARQDFHDLQLGTLTVTPTEVQPGQSITINAVVSNKGPFSEIFNLTVSYGTPAVVMGTAVNQNVSVAGASTFSFPFNTAGLSPGFYTILGNVSLVRDDVPGNNVVSKTFRVLGEQSPLSQTPLLLAAAAVASIATLAVVAILLRRRRGNEDAE